MKKILFILLILAGMVFAQDTANTHIQLKDTVVTTTIAGKQNNIFFNLNFWQILISVSAGIILTLIGVYFTNKHQRILADKQIQHQLEVKQAEIDVATKRKFIDDMIDQSKNISKCVFTIIQLSNDLIGSYFRRSFDNDDKDETDKLDYKISKIYDDFSANKEEFYYAVSILFFYLNKNDDRHQQLTELVNNLKTNYDHYTGYIWAHSHNSEHYEENMKQHGNDLRQSYSVLKDKIQELIDVERKHIDEIIFKKPD